MKSHLFIFTFLFFAAGERTGKGYYNYPKGSRVEQPAPELEEYLAKTRQASSLHCNGKVIVHFMAKSGVKKE